MGLYLRKSVRVGPLRFNLSKGGVGVSAGIKGFRVGTGGQLRAHGCRRHPLPGHHSFRVPTPPSSINPWPRPPSVRHHACFSFIGSTAEHLAYAWADGGHRFGRRDHYCRLVITGIAGRAQYEEAKVAHLAQHRCSFDGSLSNRCRQRGPKLGATPAGYPRRGGHRCSAPEGSTSEDCGSYV